MSDLAQRPRGAPPAGGPFGHTSALVQSWEVLALSHELGRGRALGRELFDRRIALYRGEDGRVRALSARCPHLGADLARGRVVGGELRCGLHHWRFAGDGRCVAAPGLGCPPDSARAFAYPVEERYGAVWVFNGPRALFPVPHFPGWERGGELLAARLPPLVLDCHPHVVAGNGLDVRHFQTVHGFAFAEEPRVEEPDPYRVRLRMKISLRGHNLFEKAARLLAGDTVSAVFTTWGGNLATAEFELGPVPVRAIFTNRLLPNGRSASQTILLMRRSAGLGRWLGVDRLSLAVAKRVMAYVLREDTAVLEGLRFKPHPAGTGEPLAAFIRQVNGMGTFNPGPGAG